MHKNTPIKKKAPLHFAILATDIALFTIKNNTLLARIIGVNRPPHFPNSLGLPGGLIGPNETAEESVKRLLFTKAGIKNNSTYTEQLYTFSELDRDPRGRVVAVAYLGLVAWENLSEDEKEDAPNALWMPINKIKHLAYDHDEMLKISIQRLQSRITYTTLISKLLPSEFTLTELEKAYECILLKKFDRRNFRKRINKLKIIEPIPKKKRQGKFRPAQLYKFTNKKITNIEVI